jgi:hypothetical protein
LSREQLSLLESFLRSRGNLKEMERELGISYPTVRGRVDALVRALGLGDADTEPLDEAAVAGDPSDAGPGTEDQAEQRREILERLAKRELSADAAAAALRALGEG